MSRSPLYVVLALALLPFTVAADDTGCQSESSGTVDQDRVHASYWLYRDSQTDRTFARAQFRFGSAVGTTLILDGDAAVTFAGQPMAWNAALDWHEAILAGDVREGDFVYTDADGDVHVNPAPTMTPIDFAAVPSTVPRDRSLTLGWTGAPIQEGEDLEVVIAVEPLRLDFERWDQRAVGATSIVLDAGKLSQLAPGPAVISLRRHRDYPLAEDAGGGGKLTTTYQPRDGAVTLE